MRYYWPGAARSIESLDRVPLSEKCVHHIRYVILLFSFHHVKINFTTWKIFSRSKNWFHEVRNDFTKCEMISRCQISIHQVILISPSELWLHQVTFHQVNFTKVPRPEICSELGGVESPLKQGPSNRVQSLNFTAPRVRCPREFHQLNRSNFGGPCCWSCCCHLTIYIYRHQQHGECLNRMWTMILKTLLNRKML